MTKVPRINKKPQRVCRQDYMNVYPDYSESYSTLEEAFANVTQGLVRIMARSYEELVWNVEFVDNDNKIDGDSGTE